MIDLLKGDCFEKMKDIPSKSIDAIITDPPYGVTSCKWDTVIPFDLMWKELNRLIKDNKAIILFGNEPFSSALRISNIKNYKYDWVWNKVRSSNPFLAKKQPLRIVENIMVFNTKVYYPIMVDDGVNEAKKRFSKMPKKSKQKTLVFNGACEKPTRDMYHVDDLRFSYPKNILNFNRFSNECNTRNALHPTQKPVALMEYLIKTYTKEDETVLDFTMGSGSTMIACLNTNRRGIGIEKDLNYFDIARKRIEDHKAQLQIF